MKLVIRSALAALLCAGLTSVVACSSDTSSGGGTDPGSVTSLDSSKDVSALSDGERDQYCKDAAAYQSRAITAKEVQATQCLLAGALAGGLTGTPDTAKCKTAFDECMKKELPTSNSPTSCTSFTTKTKACKAGVTVAQYNKCIADQTAQLKEVAKVGNAVCNDLGKQGTALESCKIVDEKCGASTGD